MRGGIMWHTCDMAHITNPVSHLCPFNAVHVLLRVVQSSTGTDEKPLARSYGSPRVPIPRRHVANISTPLQHIISKTLLVAWIIAFPRSLVPVRVSSAHSILYLKMPTIDLLMRGF